MIRVHVGVAGNMEPQRHVAQALEELRRRFDMLAQAPVYRTRPIGRPDQGDYWNTVVVIGTYEDIKDVGGDLRTIEEEHGRVRTDDPYAARTLDLDILMVDGEPLDAATEEELRRRPWNRWCLHRLGDGPRPDVPEPALASP